jgi:hypothetical protein
VTSTNGRQAWLTAHGRLSWLQTRVLLDETTCAWADLDGFHCEGPPTDPPLTTHVWAWSDQRMLRLRVDGAEAVAAELQLGPPDMNDAADNTGNASAGKPVQFTEQLSTSWPELEGRDRVSVDKIWRDRQVRIFIVHGLIPLSFARLEI